MHSSLLKFDLETGLSPDVKPIPRRLSEMAGMYTDEATFAAMTETDDPLVYEFYDLGVPDAVSAVATVARRWTAEIPRSGERSYEQTPKPRTSN